jgi:Arc/MetJ-type ribon-helix-helix transcriptional regulator
MEGKKVKITATMDPDLVEWIDEKVKSRRFASRSHALEVAVAELINSEDSKIGGHESP